MGFLRKGHRQENHMTQFRTLCLTLLLCAAGAGSVDCADIVLIAHPDIVAGSATRADIKAIFLETKTSLSDGSRVLPVILRGSACEAFARNYLGKSAIGLETYYRGLVFSGTGIIPKMLASEDEVIAYVAKTRGAIGYVSSAASANRVKVLVVR
jgi:ABC-type phosphate transport system substrate-binding protein